MSIVPSHERRVLVAHREASWRLSMYKHGRQNSLLPLIQIWKNLAQNQRYSDLIQIEDVSTFICRSGNEGLTFLTTVLPKIGKALDSFHATGMWSCPSEFSSDEAGIPIFLGKPIKLALDGISRAVDCVRQMTLIFYKLEVDYDQETVDAFLANFKKVDEELHSLDFGLSSVLIERARRIILRVLCNTNPLEIRPRHGTGATACHTPNSDKYHTIRFFKQLDDVFHYPDYFFYSYSHLVDDYEKLQEAIESVPKARVTTVPKDSRGPRIISCEPAELMYIQQGLMRLLYTTLESHPLTHGRLNFIDQSVNMELAKLASTTGRYATLDLTDASDRVSLELVRLLFPSNWFEALCACRSKSTILPDGSEVIFNKFAPMGSACCFPVEALVFWAIAVASTGISLSKEIEIYVYGDDIIVPTTFADTVISGLESVGLLVNRNKSYVKGPFRESCGGDYHNGYDVTPVRIRKQLNMSSSSLTTDTDLANSFIAKFGYDSVRSIINIIESVYSEPFPRSSLQLPCCIQAQPCASNDVFFRRRWNYNLQRFEYRIHSVFTRAYAQREPSWFELLRKELTRMTELEVKADKYVAFSKVVESSMLPGYYADGHSAQLKWQWTWLG